MASSVVDRPAGDSPIDHYKLLFRLQILAAIGCLLIVLYSSRFWASGEFLRIVGVGMLVAGAALLIGFLLGFIFAIPRVGSEKGAKTAPAEPGGANPPASEGQSDSVPLNGNLVEISDWLTKIIVGVGLVELKSIFGELGKLSYYLGPGLRPAQCNGLASCSDLLGSGQAAGLAIIVFYCALGFLLGYVWTMLYFRQDLERRVRNLQEYTQVTDLIMLADAYLNEGQLDEAMGSIDQALRNNPMDGRAVLTRARILKRQAMKPGQPANAKEKLLNQALVYADQAIALLPGKAEPIYNKACYQALLGLDRNEALGNLKSAFRLNPALRTIAAGDSDLESMREDPDFAQVVDMNRPPNP
jgi:hypothetical protein